MEILRYNNNLAAFQTTDMYQPMDLEQYLADYENNVRNDGLANQWEDH